MPESYEISNLVEQEIKKFANNILETLDRRYCKNQKIPRQELNKIFQDELDIVDITYYQVEGCDT